MLLSEVYHHRVSEEENLKLRSQILSFQLDADADGETVESHASHASETEEE